jgi:tetratricopeptide (TPR) repeat protein
MIRNTLLLIALLFTGSAFSEESRSIDEILSNPRMAIIEAKKLLANQEVDAAISLMTEAQVRYPRNQEVLNTYADALFEDDRLGAAERLYEESLNIGDSQAARLGIEAIEAELDKYIRNLNFAVIMMQKSTDAGNFDTTIAIADRAIEKYPDKAVLLASFRKSLQIDPFNQEARSYIEDIRTTEQAQISTEAAEWMSIAKDKVGDFIVTFLALFAAFITNSLVAPVILQVKLGNARRLFNGGNYDEFTDLIEGLLDQENFGPLRANFRFMLRQVNYAEAQEILNKYVVTMDRLPTLIKILEREYEKMLEAEGS